MNTQEIISRLKTVESIKNVELSEYKGVTIDSRNCAAGKVFIALKGENTDGNLYAKSAVENGCAFAVVDEKAVFDELEKNAIYVHSSFETLNEIGSLMLENSKALKICITGSVGKTSTKELFGKVFGAYGKTYVSHGNFNNELGVPIVAASLDMDAEFAVFEFGTNSKGEIGERSSYVVPDVAVVTNIGHSHIGRFGAKEDLAKEKFSIADSMSGGTLWTDERFEEYAEEFVNKDIKIRYFGKSERADVRLVFLSRTESGIDFDVTIGEVMFSFHLNHFYDHFVNNALAVIGAAFDAGILDDEIQNGFDEFSAVKGRGALLKAGSLSVVDDTYNAGFESVISAIKNLAETGAEKKYAVIGEMGEIEGFEAELYGEIIQLATESSSINFLFVGNGYKEASAENIRVFENLESVKPALDEINSGMILFKASRAGAFEKLVAYMTDKGDNIAL